MLEFHGRVFGDALIKIISIESNFKPFYGFTNDVSGSKR